MIMKKLTYHIGQLAIGCTCAITLDVVIVSIYAWHLGHLHDFLCGLKAWVEGLML